LSITRTTTPFSVDSSTACRRPDSHPAYSRIIQGRACLDGAAPFAVYYKTMPNKQLVSCIANTSSNGYIFPENYTRVIKKTAWAKTA